MRKDPRLQRKAPSPGVFGEDGAQRSLLESASGHQGQARNGYFTSVYSVSTTSSSSSFFSGPDAVSSGPVPVAEVF